MSRTFFSKNQDGQWIALKGIFQSNGQLDAFSLVSTNDNGYLDAALFDPNVPIPTSKYIQLPAFENLSINDFVNIFDSGSGVYKVRKASTDGKKAHGFVLANYTSADISDVYIEGLNTGLSNLNPGTDLYLSSTPGSYSTTENTTIGQINQQIGYAFNSNTIKFNHSLASKVLPSENNNFYIYGDADVAPSNTVTLIDYLTTSPIIIDSSLFSADGDGVFTLLFDNNIIIKQFINVINTFSTIKLNISVASGVVVKVTVQGTARNTSNYSATLVYK